VDRERIRWFPLVYRQEPIPIKRALTPRRADFAAFSRDVEKVDPQEDILDSVYFMASSFTLR
jgi:hypothetical protein